MILQILAILRGNARNFPPLAFELEGGRLSAGQDLKLAPALPDRDELPGRGLVAGQDDLLGKIFAVTQGEDDHVGGRRQALRDNVVERKGTGSSSAQAY